MGEGASSMEGSGRGVVVSWEGYKCGNEGSAEVRGTGVTARVLIELTVVKALAGRRPRVGGHEGFFATGKHSGPHPPWRHDSEGLLSQSFVILTSMKGRIMSSINDTVPILKAPKTQLGQMAGI